MRVLFWTSQNSPWILNYMDHFLLKYNYEVWMLDRSNRPEYKRNIEYLKRKNVHVITFPKIVSDLFDGKIEYNNWKVLYSHILQLKTILKSGPFDLINLHFVGLVDLIDVVILKCIFRKKIILSYWGSDLLRVSDKELRFMGKLARHADFITFDNEDLYEKFRKVYKWFNKVPTKTVFLGLPILNVICEKEKSKTISELKKKWGISEDKTVIAVGYNGIPEQQHRKVLRAIETLEKPWKDKMILLLQMTYGGNEKYSKQVISAAKATGCEYLEIQRFLSDDEIAELRIMTDIFINAQVTDAFSGSVCENLFAKTILLNAKWLRYKEFEKYGFQYVEFESFQEIPELIKGALEKKTDVLKNRELIWKMRSWESCAPKWERVYHNVVK